MALRVARGLFRLWLVLSVLWIGGVSFVTWRDFTDPSRVVCEYPAGGEPCLPPAFWADLCVGLGVQGISVMRPDATIKQPTKADFDVKVDDAGVHVIFRPTESHYSYFFSADGDLFRSPTFRHAKTGDTGDYPSSDVEAMAYEVAKANRRS